MKLLLCAALIVTALAGCATSREITAPDGKKVFSINCDGNALDVSYCYEKAGQLCGAAGYDVMAQDSSSTPFLMANGFRPGGFSMAGGAIVKRNIMARCKG